MVTVLSPATARAGNAVVLRSTLSFVKPGELFGPETRLTLPAGGEIDYITPDGDEHQLAGPYRGAPLGSSPASPPAGLARLADLARLIAANGSARAPRAPHADVPKNPFAVDIARSATVCARFEPKDSPAPPLLLWRANSAKPLSARLTRTRTGQSAALLWPAGTAAIPWPGSLPLNSDETYLLRIAAAPIPVTLLVHVPTKPAPEKAALAALALAAAGCTEQGRRRLGLS